MLKCGFELIIAIHDIISSNQPANSSTDFDKIIAAKPQARMFQKQHGLRPRMLASWRNLRH